MFRGAFAILFIGLLCGPLSGCVGDKPGDRCDGFFQDSCRRPMRCVATGTAKICGTPCEESGFADKTCADKTLTPLKVASAGGTPLGCTCIPR